MPTVAPLALPRVQIVDNVGKPIPGALIYTYAAGTSTPLATYINALGVITNTNPVVADSGGFCDIYLIVGTAYKINVRTPAIPGPSVDVYPATDNIVLSPQATLQTLGGFSQDVNQGNLIMDPGEMGSEILATTAAQEIEQLRFRIQEMSLTTNWRTSTRLKNLQAPMETGPPPASNGILPEGILARVSSTFFIPDDYAGGDITYIYFRRANSPTGDFFLRHTGYRARLGAVLLTVFDVNASGSVPDTTLSGVPVIFPASVIQKGDILRFDVFRGGDNPTFDTNTDALTIDGFIVRYLGVA